MGSNALHLLVGFSVAVNSATVLVLTWLARHVAERNRELKTNTAVLRKHNILLDAVAELMITLYPAGEIPDYPSHQHRLFAVAQLRDARAKVQEIRATMKAVTR